MKKIKLVTVVGTRPEIIRLSRIINKFDEYFDHVLVNTSQNYDRELNEIFFKDLKIRKPDYNLGLIEKNSIKFIGKRAGSSRIQISVDDLYLFDPDLNEYPHGDLYIGSTLITVE